MNYREICLKEATRVVCQSREQEYDSPENSFQKIKELWEAYLGIYLLPHDVAMMMALLKIARIKSGHFKKDSFVDAAGYVACGYEIARKENAENSGVTSKDKATSETGERGENEARGENVTRGDNDTPPDTDTRTETDPQTETNTQTQFQFGVKNGETKTPQEREAEIKSCIAYGLRESQRENCSPVFRDAQRGIGPDV